MKKYYLIFLLFISLQFSVAQTLFSENIGTPSSTTTIANNAFQNNGLLTYSNGSQSNAADIRKTNSSSEYSNASAGGNVFFTSTSGSYGFSIESINATNYSSLTLDYGYRKEAASVHANFSVDYWNGTSWIVLANSAATLFNESANATAKWYLAKTLTLPNDAQINGLKIRFVKTGTTAIRIDDIILTGTEQVTPTVINSIVTSITNNSATFGGNVTATGGSAITSTGTVYAVTSINNNPIIGEASVITLNTPTPNSGTGTFSNSSGALLLSNVEYSYNVFAIKNGGAVGYGTVATFYTLATIPTAPSISNATANTLTITIGADANSNTTTYSLFETTTNSYVQSNGSLGGTAVYKTAADWGNIIVVGLTPSTTYSFQSTAKNGANVTTTASVTTNGTTLLPNSILSDIVFNSDSSTSDNTNINYANYQATSITSTVNSVGVMGFHLRDGGAGHNDTDNLGTELTAISFDVTNGANIRSARLFVGNSPKGISVTVVNGVLTFTGLTDIIAADDDQLAINLRVTFNTTVTDNEQMQFKIASVTANMNSSQFAMANGGGASSSVAGDINRIEVTASKLEFAQQPPPIVIAGTNMNSGPVVSTLDENGNIDFDFTGTINLTSTCILTLPQEVTAIAGIATFTFNILDYSVSETGFVLTASSSNLVMTNSTFFDIQATPEIVLEELPQTNCVINTCDLVVNGGFEQFSQLPTGSGQITNACGWFSVYQSPDYFHTGSSSTNFSVPCNTVGVESCNYSQGNGYAGLAFSNGINPSEILVSKLVSPLLPNANYQLSFDVSLAEGKSSFSKTVQAFLSPDIIQVTNNTPFTIIDNQMLFRKTVTSTISDGWETLTFNFTTTNGGEEYIYLGGFQNILTQTNIPASASNCSYTNHNISSVNPLQLAYYYLDNIRLVPLNNAVFDLPENICDTTNIVDLFSLLSNAPTTGVFSGTGVVESSGNYSFDAAIAGLGTHIVSYTYTPLDCPTITISHDITVVNDGIVAEFVDLNDLVLCENVTPPVLSTTSDNGITGSWSPSTINTMTSGDYTFTSDSGQCSSSQSVFTVAIIDTLLAEDDNFSVTPINLLTGGTTPSVYTNDTLNGNTLINTAVTSIILSTTPSMSTLPTIDSEGIITIPSDYPSGTYIVEYELTDSVCLDYFDTANVTVFVLPKITNCPKVYLDDLCYNASQSQTSSLTIFNNANNGFANSTCDYAVIGNVLCDANNVTIELINPLELGCTINTNGTINIPAGLMPFYAESYYQLRSIEYPTVVSDTFRVSYGITDKVYPIYPIIYLHAGSAPLDVYSNGSVNVLNNYNILVSQINPNINGNCDLIDAVTGSSNQSNTVTITETTNPENDYYRINTQSGEIVFRTPYSSNNPPPEPTSSQSYILTYEMCINNTGATTFCNDASVVINYYYGSNREMQPVANENKIVIYPNPSSDGNFTILFNQSIKNGSVTVYNMLGQKVKQDTIQNGTDYQLNLSEAVTGNYILKINDGSQQIVKRITLNRK